MEAGSISSISDEDSEISICCEARPGCDCEFRSMDSASKSEDRAVSGLLGEEIELVSVVSESCVGISGPGGCGGESSSENAKRMYGSEVLRRRLGSLRTISGDSGGEDESGVKVDEGEEEEDPWEMISTGCCLQALLTCLCNDFGFLKSLLQYGQTKFPSSVLVITFCAG